MQLPTFLAWWLILRRSGRADPHQLSELVRMQHPAQREREIAAVAGGEVEIGKRGKVSSQASTRSLSPPWQPTST